MPTLRQTVDSKHPTVSNGNGKNVKSTQLELCSLGLRYGFARRLTNEVAQSLQHR